MNVDSLVLENILLFFENEKFSKEKAASVVGGPRTLMRLIEAGKIDVPVKQSESGNGKWYCNAAQCLRHCKRRPKKK